MPSGLFSADTQFPQFLEAETDAQKLQKMQSYLYMLLEQLRFTLSNVDKGYFNETGFQEISEEIAGPVIKKYESLDLTVTSGDGNEAQIQITGDGLETAAKKITFSGMVTFKALEDESDYTTINGANIKTGTISAMTLYGSNFYCTLDDDFKHSGEILFCYPTRNKTVGGLRIDTEGAGGAEENKKRIYLYADSGFVLKLYSDTRISVEAGDLVYADAYRITLNSNRGEVNLTAPRINLNGTVYVNGTALGATVTG